MRRDQLDKFRTQLQALADRVGQMAAGLEEEVRSPLGGAATGGTSNMPMHLGDLGSEAYTQELDATLLENEVYVRDEALAALARIEAGTFGRCEACGQNITQARLGALPYARHCAPCATRLQSGLAVNLNDGRPSSWLGEPGHEASTATPRRAVGRDLGSAPHDTYAAGTPGGGAGDGGLAGTTIGGGGPGGTNLEAALGSGTAEADDTGETADELMAESGPTGGAVGGTPANKRAKGKASQSSEEKLPKSSVRRTKRSPK